MASVATAIPALPQVNLKLKLMCMKTVSMLELRQNSEAIIKDLRRGLAMTLTYRGKAVARLEPIHAGAEEIMPDDPLYTLGKQAGLAKSNVRLAKGNAKLSNADIDLALYGDK